MVITHLVLNDMIKVKGQVSQVALSLVDSVPAIRDLSRLFFIKLSERSNNPVYNLLGDIIGTFSQEKNSSTVTEQTEDSTVQEDAQASTDTSISNSAPASQCLSKKDFQFVMHFLLSFVQKDK